MIKWNQNLSKASLSVFILQKNNECQKYFNHLAKAYLFFSTFLNTFGKSNERLGSTLWTDDRHQQQLSDEIESCCKWKREPWRHLEKPESKKSFFPKNFSLSSPFKIDGCRLFVDNMTTKLQLLKTQLPHPNSARVVCYDMYVVYL